MITEISIKWTSDDIKSIDQTLDDKDCSIILEALESTHDANIGINWQVIEMTIDQYKEFKKARN